MTDCLVHSFESVAGDFNAATAVGPVAREKRSGAGAGRGIEEPTHWPFLIITVRICIQFTIANKTRISRRSR